MAESSVAALAQYYLEHGDLWERQTLTRARLILGDRALDPQHAPCGARVAEGAARHRLAGGGGGRPPGGGSGGRGAPCAAPEDGEGRHQGQSA